MRPSRRTLLAGGGAMAAVAAVGAVGLVSTDRCVTEAARHASVGADLLVMCAASVSPSAVESALTLQARPTRLTAHKLGGLSGADFGRLRTALVGAGGRQLFALVDEAQALVIETVLSRSGLNRRPIDIDLITIGLGRRGLVLLTGTIQE